MTDHKSPIRGQTATFFVKGTRQRDCVVLLYPDKLTVVRVRSIGTWVYVGVPAVYLAVWFLLFHKLGMAFVALWYVAGWWIWQAVARRRAARRVAASGGGVTVIPLDLVTGIQCRKGRRGANWLGIRTMTVTTTDGTEYKFDGLMEQWRDHLAQALTARGREVHIQSEIITVMPWATLGEN